MLINCEPCSAVGWTATGRVTRQTSNQWPLQHQSYALMMELHEFQGARSFPNVVIIKHVFLKITKSNLNYFYPANSFFSRALHGWKKKAICSHGTETNPSEHQMKCFLMDSPMWSQDVIDNMNGYITLCKLNDDCLEWWIEMLSKPLFFVENSVVWPHYSTN